MSSDVDATGGFLKSAKISGDTMGDFHPHGDMAIYDAMARLAQDFNVRYPLVHGQGNFGNIDGDNPAASRYTEARMTAAAEALLEGMAEMRLISAPTMTGALKNPLFCPPPFRTCLPMGPAELPWGWLRTSRRTTCTN